MMHFLKTSRIIPALMAAGTFGVVAAIGFYFDIPLIKWIFIGYLYAIVFLMAIYVGLFLVSKKK